MDKCLHSSSISFAFTKVRTGQEEEPTSKAQEILVFIIKFVVILSIINCVILFHLIIFIN